MPVATGGGRLKLLTPVKPSCDTVAASVGAVPGATLTMRRWPPAAVVPTDTVLAWPAAVAPAWALLPSAVVPVLRLLAAPPAFALVPIALPPVALAEAPVPTVVAPEFAREPVPIATALTPPAALFWPKAVLLELANAF